MAVLIDPGAGIVQAVPQDFKPREMYNIPLDISDYILIVLVSVISSVGVAGVPGPAAISTTVVLTALGLPLEGIGLTLAIDAVVDMGRTAVNATGTTVSSLLVYDPKFSEFDYVLCPVCSGYGEIDPKGAAAPILCPGCSGEKLLKQVKLKMEG